MLENVIGAITSHSGSDFETLLSSLSDGGYRAGALVIDAVRFVPQSRPRLFIIAIRKNRTPAVQLSSPWPNTTWHSPALITAYTNLPDRLRSEWIWWNLPQPTSSIRTLAEVVETEPVGVAWHTPAETEKLLSMMSDVNRAKVREAASAGKRIVGTVYKRTRPGKGGVKIQRAEVRFDGVSGCLRTPVGGSSRQTLIIVEGDRIVSRLLSPREAARLMGIPESYPIPSRYNEAYHLFGDGLVVPVVEWLEKHLLWPLASAEASSPAAARVA